MSESGHIEEPKKFTPKDPPKLNPPKEDLITMEDLAKCDGTHSSHPTYVAIMGIVFDVSGNTAYSPNNPYHGTYLVSHYFATHAPNLGLLAKERKSKADPPDFNAVFAGKDASRALAQSSLKPQDCTPEWEDLPDKEKGVLKDWFTFFSKRYNIVGKVQQ